MDNSPLLDDVYSRAAGYPAEMSEFRDGWSRKIAGGNFLYLQDWRGEIVRFDEVIRVLIMVAVVNLDDVLALQRCYPQIYLACHVDHLRRKSTAFGLTPKESSLLAHLDKAQSTTARALADHVGVADSTLSAALKRLETLGCITRQSSPKDSPVSLLRLTEKGEAALAAASVLETDRARALLAKLKPSARREALHGLDLLARAARQLQNDQASIRRLKDH